MKLVSLNLCGYSDWQSRRDKIVSFLNDINADIVCLQEVKFDVKKGSDNQANYLNSLLSNPYKYSNASITKFYRSSNGEPFREGLATLSRHPILNAENLALTQAEDDKHVRIIQNLDINDKDTTVKISNVHFSNNAHSVEQLKEVLAILDSRNEVRIIMGDFNIFDLSQVKEIYSDKYKSSADFTKYMSYPSKTQTLDYVLLPHEHSFLSVSVQDGLSDHNALIVDIS
ncbi:endonuclease/exonuclease/phosphatase family protein [Candidatus Saccharibacteria bacterium]|nr:endonuclease/exonuclease/phosphatase family protein [Candidatus Saccharibacteria bacterium]